MKSDVKMDTHKNRAFNEKATDERTVSYKSVKQEIVFMGQSPRFELFGHFDEYSKTTRYYTTLRTSMDRCFLAIPASSINLLHRYLEAKTKNADIQALGQP